MTEQREGNNVFGGTPQTGGIKSVSAADVLRDDFGITVPQEIVPLPSMGKVYSGGSTLFGRESVEIKAMGVREEDILTSRALIKKGTVITQLIKSCLIDKSIDVDEMISGDRNALMVAIRITGYGAEYSANLECGKCGEKHDETFHLDQLPLKRLEADPVVEGQNLFEYELPRSKIKVQFKLLTPKDEEEILAEQEKKKKLGLKAPNGTDTIVTDNLRSSIVSIKGITDRAKIINFINNGMGAFDSRALRKHIQDIQPGIDMKQVVTCENCGNIEEVQIPIGVTFFWPDAA